MSRKPDERIELGEDSSGHDHWVELYRNGERLRAVKKNSMPVFDSSTYRYEKNADGWNFVSGRKSCSGAGKNRSDSPSDEIDNKICEAVKELEPAPVM